MDEKDFKHIIGQTVEGKPAVIRFYGPVTAESTARFNEEFLWLQNYVKPSKILVMVNSEGGSVVAGMSTFSVMQSCPIETHCVIEGIAASMGSVIWAAGTKLFMHDYSILMVHNPFVNSEDTLDESTKNMLKAFRCQLETIYHKRFGLDKAKVREIMDGEGDADGTYLSASEAVKAGILPSKHIIKTSEQVRADIQTRLEGAKGAANIRDIMAAFTKDEESESKLIKKTLAILEQNKKNTISQQAMNEKELTFDSVCAQLGISKEAPVANVPSRIAELIKAEAKLATVKAELDSMKSELDQLKIQHKGKETEVKNLTDKLTDAESKLKAYQDKEAAEKATLIENMIEAAIKDGKITADSKAEWVEMAQSNLAMVEKTLAGITPREVISEEIAKDPKNVEAAADAAEDVDKELNDKIMAAVGKDFKFRKF